MINRGVTNAHWQDCCCSAHAPRQVAAPAEQDILSLTPLVPSLLPPPTCLQQTSFQCRAFVHCAWPAWRARLSLQPRVALQLLPARMPQHGASQLFRASLYASAYEGSLQQAPFEFKHSTRASTVLTDSNNSLNRYSLPVTRSRNGPYDMNLDQTNTTRFLFGDDEPRALHRGQTPDEHFPTLVRREDQMVSVFLSCSMRCSACCHGAGATLAFGCCDCAVQREQSLCTGPVLWSSTDSQRDQALGA